MAIGITIAVVKPWNLAAGPPEVPASDPPAATATRSEPPAPGSGVRRYDPRLFGGREPDPAWELWPAGYVVYFGMAGPVRVGGQDEPGASSGQPPTGAPATPSPDPTGGPGASPGVSPHPAEAFVVDLGPADHLIALGINTPLEVRVVDVRLWAARGGRCCEVAVSVVRLETLWESDHFHVIGIADPDLAGEAGPWPPGEYRLDLITATDEVRVVRLRVAPPTG